MTTCTSTHQFGDRRLGDLATCCLSDGHAYPFHRHMDVDGRWWQTSIAAPAAPAQPPADDFIARALDWRGVTDPCLKCRGAGVHTYSSGATWRGGMGTAMPATDVCDVCWGTGDRYRTGCDLRRLRDEESARVARAAVTLIAESIGAGLSSARPAIYRIIEAIEKLADKRGVAAAVHLPELARALAKTLRLGVGA